MVMTLCLLGCKSERINVIDDVSIENLTFINEDESLKVFFYEEDGKSKDDEYRAYKLKNGDIFQIGNIRIANIDNDFLIHYEDRDYPISKKTIMKAIKINRKYKYLSIKPATDKFTPTDYDELDGFEWVQPLQLEK